MKFYSQKVGLVVALVQCLQFQNHYCGLLHHLSSSNDPYPTQSRNPVAVQCSSVQNSGLTITHWAWPDEAIVMALKLPQAAHTGPLLTDTSGWQPEATTWPLQLWESPVQKGTTFELDFPFLPTLPVDSQSQWNRTVTLLKQLSVSGQLLQALEHSGGRVFAWP